MIYQVANIFSGNTRFKDPMLKSDLCEYSDVYIVVKGTITVEESNPNNPEDNKLIFKNNGPFTLCISKVNNVFIDNAEYSGIVLSIQNFLEYSDIYLRNYYYDEVNDNASETNADKYSKTDKKTATRKQFEYKTKIIGSTPYDNNTLDRVVVVPLKYSPNFQRSLDLSFIKFERKLDLSF